MTRRQAAAARLCDGSGIVARRIGRALVPEDRLLATLFRCGSAIYLGRSAFDLMHQQPLWAAIGAGAWCTAAWRAEREPDAEPEPAGPAHSDAEIYEGTVGYLRALIGDRNGVHLGEVLGGLQGLGYVDPTVTAAEFGRQLQRRGIPVRASLKVAGSVSPGVHRDDLPPLPQPLPDPALADAG